MNRQMKKAALASAVAAALGAGANVAQAIQIEDGILFPYLVKGNAVTTLITVINRGTGTPLDLTYLYKIPTAEATTEATQNDLACQHFDGQIPSSKNDIITFDAGRYLDADNNYILFNDPGAGATKYNGTPSIVEEPTWIGQLTVEAQTGGPDTLWGEAMVFEYGSGAMWGYLAYNTLASNYDKEGTQDFSKVNARNGEVLDSNSPPHPIDVVPMGESVHLVERLLVTPVAENQANLPYPTQSWTTFIGLGVDEGSAPRWYDRNEGFRSEPVAEAVTCVGRITLKNYMSTSLKSFLTDGGNTDVVVLETGNGGPSCPDDVDACVDEAIVQKLIYNLSNNGFPGATGLWNTAVWLRDMTAPTSP